MCQHSPPCIRPGGILWGGIPWESSCTPSPRLNGYETEIRVCQALVPFEMYQSIYITKAVERAYTTLNTATTKTFKVWHHQDKSYMQTLILPSLASIISEAIAWISLKFLPRGHTLGHVLKFWKQKLGILLRIFSFSLTWDTMGAKTSKRYSSLKSLLKLFKTFPKFLLRCPHKSTVWDFLNLEFRF